MEMEKLLKRTRLVLLVTAVLLMAIGFLPQQSDAVGYSLDAAATAAPCLDIGCPGGNVLCDYVELGGEWYPCNLPMPDAE
jgi:hypothetical protein